MRLLTLFAFLAATFSYGYGLWSPEGERLQARLGLTAKTQKKATQAKRSPKTKRPHPMKRIDPVLETQLEQMMASYDLPYGAVAILDVHSGRTLAAAGHSKREPAKSSEMAFMPRFPSASVFKVPSAAALLEAKTFNPKKCVKYRGGRRRIHPGLLKPRRGEGRCANLERMVSKSVNVALARSIFGHVDRDELVDVSHRFGFEKTFPGLERFGVSHFDLPYERKQMAIRSAGFGDHRISAYHAAASMAMIARGGNWGNLAPKGVKPKALEPAVARQLAKLMEATTVKGTARKRFHPRKRGMRNLRTAGKTGSLIVDGLDHSWFVGFAPADDPQIAFAAIVVNDVKELWHIRALDLAQAAVKASLFGVTPPRANSLVALTKAPKRKPRRRR